MTNRYIQHVYSDICRLNGTTEYLLHFSCCPFLKNKDYDPQYFQCHSTTNTRWSSELSSYITVWAMHSRLKWVATNLVEHSNMVRIIWFYSHKQMDFSMQFNTEWNRSKFYYVTVKNEVTYGSSSVVCRRRTLQRHLVVECRWTLNGTH